MSRLECPLAILARERKWRARVEADGAGVAEIGPDVTLEVDRRAGVGWTVAVEFRLRGAPQEIGDLTSLAETLHAAARTIRGAEARQLRKTPTTIRARMAVEPAAVP